MTPRVTYESLLAEAAAHLTNRHGIGTVGASLPQLNLRHAEAHICGDFYGKPKHARDDYAPDAQEGGLHGDSR